MSNYTVSNSKKKFNFTNFQSEKAMQTGLILLVLLAIVVGGWFGYRSYRIGQVQVAQKQLSSCLAEYEKVKSASNVAESQWQTIDKMCSVGYEKYKHTAVGPFFLGVQADALLVQGKTQEAVVLLDKLVSSLPTQSPLYYPYQTKKILVALDQEENVMQSPAFEELKKLAYDKDNNDADYALYYVGEYYWHDKNIDLAKQVWQDLDTRFKAETKNGQSPWALLAQYKLQQIS